jgi:hypothetical protein
MPRWTDLTPDQCADVRVVRDLVNDGQRWPLDDIGVAELRPLVGAAADDPLYDGWEVTGPDVAVLERVAGRAIDPAAGGWTVEATGSWAARLALEGPGGYLFLELLDHRRVGAANDGWVLIEVNLSLFGPHVCVLPWFSAPAGTLDAFAARLADTGDSQLDLDGGLSLQVGAETLAGRIVWPDWADLRFGPVPYDPAGARASAQAFRDVLAELGQSQRA